MLKKAFIPYKGYYSTPFSRWQGSLQHESAITLGAATGKRWLESKGWDPLMIQYVVFGNTVGQHRQFYSSPWAAALLGAATSPGLALSQACTTSTTAIWTLAVGVEVGQYDLAAALMSDRCSNGPHTIWPNPKGPGGEVISENWNMDNFNDDPNVGLRMIETAENTAKLVGFTKEQADELALHRYQQYLMALENDREFQKRYMFPVEIQAGKKQTRLVEEDEGITPSTAEGLAKLKPVIPGGILSFGAQTHPADGNCMFIVCTEEKAKELSADPSIPVQIVSYGFHRAEKGYMAAAPVPAAKMALERAGKKITDMKAIKTHNPFIANDLYMAHQFGIDGKGTKDMSFNDYGSSLVYGHPQGPTAGRNIVEGIEEVAMRGGGYLLWAGCAAGDTGGSMVIKVG